MPLATFIILENKYKRRNFRFLIKTQTSCK